MLDKYYVQRIIKVPTKRNVAGDIVVDPAGEQEILWGRFRVITNAVRVNNRDELRSDDAMVWFSIDTAIKQFDIVKYENSFWQITKITEARRLGGTAIQFLKCFASSYEVVS